jgi:hypothetical protein
LLQQPQTTTAARQFICLQLRQIGTPAESILALLSAPTRRGGTRAGGVAGPESTAALRNALGTLQGGPLIRVINALERDKTTDVDT